MMLSNSRILAYIREHMVDSFIATTNPITRFIIGILFTLCIFMNNPVVLGVFTIIVLLTVLSSLDTIGRDLKVLAIPVFINILAIAVIKLSSFIDVDFIQSFIKSSWKFLNLFMAALVFKILLPQDEIITVAYMLRLPKISAAFISCFRAVDIGIWALLCTIKTIRIKKITFFKTPLFYSETLLVGFLGHFFEFLECFVLSLQVRGVASLGYDPENPQKKFQPQDAMIIFLFSAVIFLFLIVQ
ncbi:MAG: hypothetical protein Q8M98_04750 [Candidatus Cloacimonadaceae bacterium]|nr:hypothetical protein [Candidatus Cloacimonadaceae bacterium]